MRKVLIVIGILGTALNLYGLGAADYSTFDQSEKKPSSYSLTEQERQQWQQFGAAEEQLQKNLQELIGRAPQTPSSCTAAQEYLGTFKDVVNQSLLVRTNRENFLVKLQLSKNCPKCVIENNQLVEPK